MKKENSHFENKDLFEKNDSAENNDTNDEAIQLLLQRKHYCSNCGALLKYVSPLDRYICSKCSHWEKNDFDKIREYLDEFGPTPAYTIHLATRVPMKLIEKYLKEGRLEITNRSAVQLKCEKCGITITWGRFCPACAKGELSNPHPTSYKESSPETIEKPRMRFIKVKSPLK